MSHILSKALRRLSRQFFGRFLHTRNSSNADRTPNELWSEVVAQLDACDQLTLMKVSRRFHDLSAYHLYRVLRIVGRRGRWCCAMLTSNSELAQFYCTLVRELLYCAVDWDDRHLMFPVFGVLLKRLKHVVTLKVHIPRRYTNFFLSCLRRNGIISRFCPPPVPVLSPSRPPPHLGTFNLPILRSIVIVGTVDILAIVHSRPIAEFEITDYLDLDDFKRVLAAFNSDTARRHLKTLKVKLCGVLSISYAVRAINRVMPNLQNLAVEQPELDVKGLLETFASDQSVLVSLQILVLNPYDPRSFYWTQQGEAPCVPNLISMLEKAFVSLLRTEFILRNFLTTIQLGWCIVIPGVPSRLAGTKRDSTLVGSDSCSIVTCGSDLSRDPPDLFSDTHVWHWWTPPPSMERVLCRMGCEDLELVLLTPNLHHVLTYKISHEYRFTEEHSWRICAFRCVFASFLVYTYTAHCLVTVCQQYSASLAHYMRSSPNIHLPGSQVRGIAYQVLLGLNHLHNEGIIHTGIAPSSVTLVDATSFSYTDFVNGQFVTKTHAPNANGGESVGIAGYRAPEIVFGLMWSFGVDIFAFGCLLAELHLGRPLLSASSTPSGYLTELENLLGRSSSSFVTQLSFTKYAMLYNGRGELVFDPYAHKNACAPLSVLLRRPDLYEFVRGCLRVDCAKRASASGLLHHRVAFTPVCEEDLEAQRLQDVGIIDKVNSHIAYRAPASCTPCSRLGLSCTEERPECSWCQMLRVDKCSYFEVEPLPAHSIGVQAILGVDRRDSGAGLDSRTDPWADTATARASFPPSSLDLKDDDNTVQALSRTLSSPTTPEYSNASQAAMTPSTTPEPAEGLEPTHRPSEQMELTMAQDHVLGNVWKADSEPFVSSSPPHVQQTDEVVHKQAYRDEYNAALGTSHFNSSSPQHWQHPDTSLCSALLGSVPDTVPQSVIDLGRGVHDGAWTTNDRWNRYPMHCDQPNLQIGSVAPSTTVHGALIPSYGGSSCPDEQAQVPTEINDYLETRSPDTSAGSEVEHPNLDTYGLGSSYSVPSEHSAINTNADTGTVQPPTMRYAFIF
ncbi:hypothetical protein NMY22_g6427 [Coprinellus aureogranulatus]|nr:hypothetical protein NMY22_g6427 [Coprinellus aureogranulatus]